MADSTLTAPVRRASHWSRNSVNARTPPIMESRLVSSPPGTPSRSQIMVIGIYTATSEAKSQEPRSTTEATRARE